MAAKIWQMEPVQTAAKSLAAGTAVAAGLWAFQGVSKYMFGDARKNALDALEHHGLVGLEDQPLVEAMARLLIFRRFGQQAYDACYDALKHADRVGRHVYTLGSMNASRAFAIRKANQTAIEKIRIFRAILEKRMPHALEDFDEIAVDINSRIEQVCTEAVQDYRL